MFLCPMALLVIITASRYFCSTVEAYMWVWFLFDVAAEIRNYVFFSIFFIIVGPQPGPKLKH